MAYDANENGQFDMLEDDVLIGYTSWDDDEWKWQISPAKSEAASPSGSRGHALDPAASAPA